MRRGNSKSLTEALNLFMKMNIMFSDGIVRVVECEPVGFAGDDISQFTQFRVVSVEPERPEPESIDLSTDLAALLEL